MGGVVTAEVVVAVDRLNLLLGLLQGWALLDADTLIINCRVVKIRVWKFLRSSIATTKSLPGRIQELLNITLFNSQCKTADKDEQ